VLTRITACFIAPAADAAPETRSTVILEIDMKNTAESDAARKQTVLRFYRFGEVSLRRLGRQPPFKSILSHIVAIVPAPSGAPAPLSALNRERGHRAPMAANGKTPACAAGWDSRRGGERRERKQIAPP